MNLLDYIGGYRGLTQMSLLKKEIDIYSIMI